MLLASSRFFDFANMVLMAVVSDDWWIWNTDYVNGLIDNLPMSMFLMVILTVLAKRYED